MQAAVLRYRVMAYITGVVLIFLVFVGIPLQILGHPLIANDVGVVHGILYIIYLVNAWILARKLSLANRPTVLLLLAGTVPVMTFIVERKITHRYINPALDGRATAAGAGEPAVRPLPLTEHYFSPHPAARHRPGLVRVILPDVYLELATDAGVFSAGRLDPGTRLLLDAAPAPPPAGDLLDLGCGYGPVACVLAARAPGARVWAVDVNARALQLCERNAGAAGLGNVRCVTPDDPSLPARFAGLWSNPPVRIGKQALQDLLSGWLARLAPGGAGGYLVVGRNLGADTLHRWLAARGWPVTRLAARSGYRLLQVRPEGGPPGAGRAGVPAR